MAGLTVSTAPIVRVRLDITGIVQGVGFRPALARVADRHGVTGIAYNNAGSVHCEFEGPADAVDAAIVGVRADCPPMAQIEMIEVTEIPTQAKPGFRILTSRSGGPLRTVIPQDIAICADCLRELRDPADRRYGHPFITCTNCGPRYTVIIGLPYDRATTTMARFAMCPACQAEYLNPVDRRFHAQTIACRDCGPRLSWLGTGTGTGTGAGAGAGSGVDPLEAATRALAAGQIIAVKGIGGFHLVCRADDVEAVRRLRQRKSRPAKPFAVMVADLEAARLIASVDSAAAELLTSPAAPIVVLPGDGPEPVCLDVAPGLSDIGVMLAYSPLHYLLFDRLAATGVNTLVMTSANRGGSPIVFADADLGLLDDLVDGILTHDRPIHVACEDSVLTLAPDGAVLPIRRSRGYAPLPIDIALSVRTNVDAPAESPTIVATGGDLKTTLCLLGSDGKAYLSPHLGDMADLRTHDCFESALAHLSAMTSREVELIACDLHPDYATTRWARRQHLPVCAVQHHHAHAVSLLAEHRRIGTAALVVAFDGTGYGTDGTIWGGELLLVEDPASFTRVGHLAPFGLPGGETAVREPARIALDLLYRAGIDWTPDIPAVAAIGDSGCRILSQQIPRGVGCTPTTSMGRLFDAIAALLGVCQRVGYEGQAAVELEEVARGGDPLPLEFPVRAGMLDPVPLIAGLVRGLRAGQTVADLAAGFHAAVVTATTAAVGACAEAARVQTVGLTGGVFVNRLLLGGLQDNLSSSGFEVLTHAVLPCNDGGLALGQAVIAAARMRAAQPTEGIGSCASACPAR